MPLQQTVIGAVIVPVITTVFGGDSFILKAIRGWAGLKNCGNLFEYKIDAENDGANLVGVRLVASGSPFGVIDNSFLSGEQIFQITVNTALDRPVVRMGAAGITQIVGINNIEMDIQGFGKITLVWNVNPASVDSYSIIETDPLAISLSNFFAKIDGQRTSINFGLT